MNIYKKEKDFEKVFKKGQRAFSDTVTLYYLPADDFKVGFAVSKKHGKSVKRNRIKRLLRESFRSFKLKDTQNFFFVIIPKVKEEYRLDLFKRDMNYIFRKIKVL